MDEWSQCWNLTSLHLSTLSNYLRWKLSCFSHLIFSFWWKCTRLYLWPGLPLTGCRNQISGIVLYLNRSVLSSQRKITCLIFLLNRFVCLTAPSLTATESVWWSVWPFGIPNESHSSRRSTAPTNWSPAGAPSDSTTGCWKPAQRLQGIGRSSLSNSEDCWLPCLFLDVLRSCVESTRCNKIACGFDSFRMLLGLNSSLAEVDHCWFCSLRLLD